MSDDLHYPNLEHCVIVPGAASSNKNAPPNVTISAECLEAMDAPLPELYDFHVEKDVLRKQTDEVDVNQTLSQIASGTKRDVAAGLSSFQREAFKKMKSITDASDDACISILSQNGFQLNNSIEAFYRGER
jgi:hypothetical protein